MLAFYVRIDEPTGHTMAERLATLHRGQATSGMITNAPGWTWTVTHSLDTARFCVINDEQEVELVEIVAIRSVAIRVWGELGLPARIGLSGRRGQYRFMVLEVAQ